MLVRLPRGAGRPRDSGPDAGKTREAAGGQEAVGEAADIRGAREGASAWWAARVLPGFTWEVANVSHVSEASGQTFS